MQRLEAALKKNLINLKPHDSAESQPNSTNKNNNKTTNSQKNTPSSSKENNNVGFKQTLASSQRNSTMLSEVSLILQNYQKLKTDIKNSPSNSRTLRNNFSTAHKIVPFKCVNSGERPNNPNIAPKFEEGSGLNCLSSDYTLWGVPLSDGKMAVFPNPTLQYESNVHLYGGMKKLFESNYQIGTKQITVRRPAIITKDFQNIDMGKLELT